MPTPKKVSPLGDSVFNPAFGSFSTSDDEGDLVQVALLGALQGTGPLFGGDLATTTTPTLIKASAGTSTSNSSEWTGITFAQSGGYYPPDNALAAGPINLLGAQSVMSAENGAVELTTFSKGVGTTNYVSATAFFGTPRSGYSYTDPKILFDSGSQRFIASIDEINVSTGQSYLVYEVSANASPTSLSSGWTRTEIETTETSSAGSTFADQPLIAENGGWLYIDSNQFTSADAFEGNWLTLVANSLPNTGTPSTLSYQLGGPNDFSFQPATVEHGLSGPQFFLAYGSDGSNASLSLIAFSGSALIAGTQSGNHISGVTVSGTALIQDYGTQAGYAVAQSGTSGRLDAGDGRITSAILDATNHVVYAVMEVLPTSGSTVPTDELVKIDVTNPSAPLLVSAVSLNALISHGVSGLSAAQLAGSATFNASLALDGNGDLLANFNVSGKNMLPADVYAVWKAQGGIVDINLNPSSVVDYQNSAHYYVDPSHSAVSRWGDYSTAVADPSMANAFFISNEYDNGTIMHYNSWGTAIAHVLIA
ncbi:hypothetical protein KRR38_32755 [Novosphingobium sp. G106]|uniref:hypothetical protein n=1 Tax=Novosphingobium sp. G106 TaxID=2849500 RepID=UPI001C2D54AF|nr:hypothetical protein [Novosphingobium sp. G106]MBV1692303.1 hypothetical protein [Novosphingobium sp. G106]